MLNTSKTLTRIIRDNQAIKFKLGSNFSWSSDDKTIVYTPVKSEQELWLLMHELAHATLHHHNYKHDIDLVRLEAAAWAHAKNKLAVRYNLVIDDNFIEDNLDTYRLWLHSRSLCPNCKQTGIQQKKNTYNCINCRCSWQVNEARLCNLRRKVITA